MNALDAKPQTQPPEPESDLAGIALGSLNAYSPDLAAIRETLKALEEKGLDPREAYLHLTEMRPKDWPVLPTFEELMGE